MSAEDFQLIDDTKIDISISKGDFAIYHQQNAQLNEADKNAEFIFGEKNN